MKKSEGFILIIGPCIVISPAIPCGANATTKTKIIPKYKTQASVMSDKTVSRYVNEIAPIIGPKKFPTPPIYALNKTKPD